MKLLYQDSALEFCVSDECITWISIENKAIFRRMLFELMNQCDGNEGPWILNHNSAAIDIEKYCHCIDNMLCIDTNGKSILTKLQSQLTKEATHLTEDVADIMNALHAFFYKLEFGYPFAIRHKLEIGINDLIKVGAFNFEVERNGDIADLVTYVEVVQYLMNPKLFVLVNIDLLLNPDELNQLLQTLLSKQLTIVCLTVGIAEELDLAKIPINRYILDNDFCLI